MKVKTAEWNKIVRDGIPEIIQQSGGIAKTRIIEDSGELDRLIRQKLNEEAVEIQQADTEHLLEELGDLETAVDALLAIHGITREELAKQQKDKDFHRGTFSKRIFLISTKEK